MDDQRLDQIKTRQKRVWQEEQNADFIESENYPNPCSQDMYQNVDLHDSTSEWEKQKEALKKINYSINRKNQKENKNDKEQEANQSED
jgi:hypothetical protein